MYARDYRQNKSGAVRAFEDAYAKRMFFEANCFLPLCTKRVPDGKARTKNAENNAASSAGSAHPDARSGGRTKRKLYRIFFGCRA